MSNDFPVDYLMVIEFNKDNVKAQFTGQEVKLGRIRESEPDTIRPHHIRLISVIQGTMKEYIRDHK